MNHGLFNNAGLKLLALLSAAVSWLAIQEAISFEDSVADIPLEIRVGEGWAVLRQSERAVRVTFKGAQDEIRKLNPKQLRVVVELNTNSTAGSIELVVGAEAVRGARNVRPVRVEPDRVLVSLDREQEKKVPVQSRVVGKPYAGEVESVVCEPAVVTLRGPAQHLRETEWVYAESVDVEGRVEGFSKRCRVLAPSDTWTPIISPPEVQVNVVLSEKMATADWEDVPVGVLFGPGAQRPVAVQPSRVRVILSGPPQSLEAMKHAVPKVFVDGRDLDASLTYDLPAQVVLPPGRSLSASVEPPAVRVVPAGP